MPLLPAHNTFAILAIGFNLAISGYGFWQVFHRAGIDRILWGLLIAAEIIFAAQASVGFILLTNGASPSGGGIHLVYGLVLLLTLPLTYLLTRRGNTRREAAFYAVLGLFLAGVSYRAIVTGRF